MKKTQTKLSEMSDKELRDYLLENRSEQRSILDLAETEERDLTDEENSTLTELRKSAEMAEARQIANLRPLPIKEDEDKEVRMVHDIFATNLRSAIKNKKDIGIEVRENIPVNSEDVADTIPVLFKDIIDALSPALVIEKVGVKMQFNVKGTPVWPTISDAEASWEGENVELVDKSIDFSKITASPKRMGLSISVSKRSLNQSNLDLYNIVVTKIARSFAALLNKTLLSFTAVAPLAPKGVFVDAAADTIELSTKPTFEEVVALETAVMDKNIELDADGFGAYIISTAMRGKLKTTPIEAGSPKMILDGNTMNGYPVVVSNYMDKDSIGFGFFEYAVVSQFGDFNLVIDGITGAKANKLNFVGNTEVDITTLRPEAFVVGKITP